MKTNINIDNYEAYLLDYVEGNLSLDETRQLKAFIAAQGLDWDELTEELPVLEAPEIVFEGKGKLKKSSKVVPIFATVTSAAAAAALLFGVFWKQDDALPSLEPIAELQPMKTLLTVAEGPIRIAPRKTIQFTECQRTVKDLEKAPERIEVETLTELQPLKPQETLAINNAGDFDMTPEIEWLRYKLETEQAYAQLFYEQSFEEEMPTSLIGKGIYRMTEGRYSSIGDLINTGLRIAKKEISKASTDIALTVYDRADEKIEFAKEQWQERQEDRK